MKRIMAWGILLVVPLLLLGLYFWFFYSIEKNLPIGGVVRRYRIHVPLGAKKGEALPLVIALHGYADHPRFMEMYTGWSNKADRERFIVVYPYGSNTDEDNKLSWNAGSCCGEGLDQSVDDLGFISSLIDEVVSERLIDKKQIFITGFSNGALLGYKIAAENPGVVKAVGVVGGAVGGKRSQDKSYYYLPPPVKPVSIIMFHGDKDTAVPYEGGPNYILGKLSVAEFTSFKESIDYWTKSNGCLNEPTREETDNFSKLIYRECDNKTKVTAITAKGRNHVWPGGLLELLVQGTKRDPSTTDEMWNFFKSE